MTELTSSSSLREYLEAVAQMQEKATAYNRGALAGKPMSADLRAALMPAITLERTILNFGREYERQPLTPDEKAMAMHAKYTVGPRYKDCFRVAQQSVDLLRHGDGPRVEYVEGMATSGILPVHHAWFTINGKVVDLTWRRDGKGRVNPHGQHFVLGTFENGWAYMGITVPYRHILENQLSTKHYTSVLSRKVLAAIQAGGG